MALVEPLDVVKFNICADSQQRIEFLRTYFLKLRDDIARKNKISLLDIEGDGTNTFKYDGEGARKTQIKGHREQQITKELNDDFTLLIKHPNIFTALLSELKNHWECFAIIRNPLSVFASWESIAHPLSNGHAPMAEHYDPELRQKLLKYSDKFSRQLSLMNWYFRSYLREINHHNIIRYEDIVASAGSALVRIIPGANIHEPLQSYNRRTVYNKSYMSQMMEVLLADEEGAWRHFYSPRDLLSVI